MEFYTEDEKRQVMFSEAIKSISRFPFPDVGDEEFNQLWSCVPYPIKNAACRHYKWMGRYLDDYFERKSDPLPESGLSDLEQAIVRTYGRYYIALYDVIFNAEQFIKGEASHQGIAYPFLFAGDLFYGLVYEDFLSSLEPCLESHWESLTAPVHLEIKRIEASFWKGEQVNFMAIARLNKEIQKTKSKQGSCGRWGWWNSFCRQVFAKHNKDLQSSLRNFGQAHSDINRLWTSHNSPACDLYKKILFINGWFHEARTGKNRRKALT